MKRLIIATLSGLLFGFVCYSFAAGGPEPLPGPIALQIILSRTLIGVAIGISALKLGHWSIHGLVWGLVFSLPLAISGMMAENPDFSGTMMLFSTLILGMIYGLLIEVITSVIFKARQALPTIQET
ncbi:MAG: hypothetical protein K9N34_07160 [Candidatus Marinimicrobia bacterium]|nr:hypothetical protein [Candidatus Neomarinimicrobiota bacterium]MCF7840758.1 hypothetical protein [Candidatus Neomarinimicrobiota bacterium]MCF7902694.1 hypothetical protein [Candidatus Neomarinimicrobiota bacterium]